MTRKSKGKQKASHPGAGSSGSNSRTPTASSSGDWDESRVSKWTPKAIAERLKEREEMFEARRQGIDVLKNEGNKRYQTGDYEGALSTYTYILKLYGAHPTIFSNMAMTLLKTEDYHYAESMAFEALKREPKNLKARFRRAIARKGLKCYHAALADLSTVLSIDPTLEDARREQRAITHLIDESTEEGQPYIDPEAIESGRYFEEPDPEFPFVDQPPLVFEEDDVDSDSEDAKHEGNGRTCKYYNRGTCIKGETCKYSHAPDHKSQRDKLGRNVCNYFLLGNCTFSKRWCYYMHDKTYLGEGWWNDERAVEKGRAFFGPDNEPDQLGSGLNAFMSSLIRMSKRESSIQYSSDGRRFEYSEKNTQKSKIPSSSKQASQPQQKDKPFVMVLALDYDVDAEFQKPTLEALKSHVLIKVVRSSTDIPAFLSSPNLIGIFAADGAIAAPEHSKLLLKIIEYVEAGGRLVLAGGFSSFVLLPHAELLFRKFGLNWKIGNYYRTTYTLNPLNLLCEHNSTFIPSYSMKAVDLAGVNPEYVVYQPDEDNDDYLPGRNNPAVVYTPVETGFLGYIGDVNWERGSIPLLIAMLGILDSPIDPGRAASGQPDAGRSSQMPCSSEGHPSPGFILLISLSATKTFPAKYERMLSALGQKTNFQQVLDEPSALDKLTSPDLKGVFVTDGGITLSRHNCLRAKLLEYVQRGGNVIFGAEFGHICSEHFSRFFQETWKLPWMQGTYDRRTGVLNVHHEFTTTHRNLPKAFSMNATHVSMAAPRDILFVGYTYLQEMMDMRGEAEWDSDDDVRPLLLEASITRRNVGKGHVGYIGDSNLEEGSIKVLLVLLCSTGPAFPSADSSSSSSVTSASIPLFKPQAKPFAIVLSFGHAKDFARSHANLLDAIEEIELEVVHGLSIQRTLDLMNSSDLKAIFIPYADIVKPEHGYLVSKLVDFTKSGGTVVVGGYFANSVRAYQVEPFFHNWGFQWKAETGTPVITNVVSNLQNDLSAQHSSGTLPQALQMTALQLSGVAEDIAVYAPLLHNFPLHRAPVIFAQVENGKLGYIGEASFTDTHVRILLAMLRMP